MTTMELRAALLKEIAYFLDDDEMMRSAIKALKNIRKAASEKKGAPTELQATKEE